MTRKIARGKLLNSFTRHQIVIHLNIDNKKGIMAYHSIHTACTCIVSDRVASTPSTGFPFAKCNIGPVS